MIPFGSMEYHPISVKDQSRLHQFGKKVLPGIFIGYMLYAERIWKGDILVADVEELEYLDASQIHARRCVSLSLFSFLFSLFSLISLFSFLFSLFSFLSSLFSFLFSLFCRPGDIPSVCIALAFQSSLRLLLFCVCLRCLLVLTWMNFRTCGCLMTPQGGTTLTTRVFRTPHHTLSPTATIWCELPAPCANIGLHTEVTWCSAFKFCVLPTGYTQCHQSTGSDGPHPHCHK